MIGRNTRMTQQEWFDELDQPGKKLTLDELCALETMHACHWLDSITVGLGVHPNQIGGHLDQIHRLLSRLADIVLRQRSRLE
jgi:hypothetical protein